MPDWTRPEPPMWPDKPKPKAERDVEKDGCAWARRQGWLTYKFSSPSNKAVPDRIFIKHGHVVFVELKKVGKRPTTLQFNRGEAIKAHGGNWYWTDTVQGLKMILEGYN